jgi:DNA polymerase III subunit delta'
LQAIENKSLDAYVDQSRELLRAGIARVPHAVLLCGAPGLGKLDFAERFAQVLLCERTELTEAVPQACGVCSSCQMCAANSHLDLRVIRPESDDEEVERSSGSGDEKSRDSGALTTIKTKPKKRASGSIKIAAIRALEDFVFVGSHRQGRRVVVITEAEAMNSVAANSLLKILEEPPATVYFILLTSKPDRLLRTLVSRCRQLSFVRPSVTEARKKLAELGIPSPSDAVLSLAGGAPFQIARWHENGLIDALKTLLETFQRPGASSAALAERWDALLTKDAGLKMEIVVEAVQRWVLETAIKARRQLTPEMFVCWRALLQSRRSASHPLNQLLFLEELASHALRATAPTLTTGRSGQ